MSVSTLEDLEALPVGTKIDVQGWSGTPYSWERTAEGWLSNGALVPTAAFAGHVSNGHVTNQTETVPAVGHFRRGPEQTYYVVELPVAPARNATVLLFPDDQNIPSRVASIPMRRLNTYPRATDGETAACFNIRRAGEVLGLYVAARAEAQVASTQRDERAQEVLTLKMRPDVGEVLPRVTAAESAVDSAVQALRDLRTALAGQTEF